MTTYMRPLNRSGFLAETTKPSVVFWMISSQVMDQEFYKRPSRGIWETKFPSS